MKKIPLFLNALLVSSLVGIAAILLLRYFLERTPTLVVGVGIAVSVLIVFLAVGLSRPDRKGAYSARQTELRTALYTMHPQARLHFLAQLFAFDAVTQELPDCILTEENGRRICVSDFLRFRAVTADEITAAYHLARAHEADAVVLCDLPDKSAVETAAYLGVRIRPLPAVTELLDEKKAYPRIKRTQKPPRLSRFVNVAFAKNRTKAYLLSALVLLTTSFITPYSVYYLIACIVCCAFAAVTVLRHDSAVR